MSDTGPGNFVADSPEQQPQPPVNQPASGTYGEKTELKRLQDALPTSQPQTGPEQGQQRRRSEQPPARPTKNPQQAQGLPGVPAAILGSRSPSGAAPQEPQTAQVDPRQARLGTLIRLASNPQVSEETREWAQLQIRDLTGA